MTEIRRFRRGMFEFAAIILGVAIALAADEWRQGFQDRATERSYLERLETDLTVGREGVMTYRDRFLEAGAAAEELVGLLESDALSADADRLLTLAVVAGRTGFNRAQLTYRTTYDELLVTGNIRVIRDQELRRMLIEHFREADSLVENVEELPQSFNARFKGLAGIRPGALGPGATALSPVRRTNLLRVLQAEPSVAEELRFFVAELADGNFFDESVAGIDELLAAVRASRGAV